MPEIQVITMMVGTQELGTYSTVEKAAMALYQLIQDRAVECPVSFAIREVL